MDDELEDKVFYQTYVSHMKILSKFAVGFSSINSPLAYIWKLCRLYILRPEVIFCGVILFILVLYLQAVDIWSRGLLGRLQATFGRQSKANRLKLIDGDGNVDYQCWEEVRKQSAAFALLGRRPKMEDRFIIEENINNNTGISFFAIFDGHGGEFAADYAKDILVKNIYHKVMQTTELLTQQRQQQKLLNVPGRSGGGGGTGGDKDDDDYVDYDASPFMKRRASQRHIHGGAGDANKENEAAKRLDGFRKSATSADDCNSAAALKQQKSPDVFTSKLNSLMRGNNGNNNNINNNNNNNNNNDDEPQQQEAQCYIENGNINFGKLITDEVLAADYKLVEKAKKTTNIAGTTALIAIIHGSRLVVANVGDSRGVMCNSRGVAIPLSFDHKPQQVRERKRIHDAGGFIAFRGVWRVAGILATSRALGDYPLKDKKLIIANPDILTFELNDHKPSFLILASDGLWDTFTNEEACTFIKEHIGESDFGARSLVMQSYMRGSVDNITVLVIVFQNGVYRIGSSAANPTPSTVLATINTTAAGGAKPTSSKAVTVGRSSSSVGMTSSSVAAAKAVTLQRSKSGSSAK